MILVEERLLEQGLIALSLVQNGKLDIGRAINGELTHQLTIKI
jgi:hypothetical protein|tara:strand:+ start:41 stop:169 length:129 start_codon:yes stop_codon:yes gene_type:complete